MEWSEKECVLQSILCGREEVRKWCSEWQRKLAFFPMGTEVRLKKRVQTDTISVSTPHTQFSGIQLAKKNKIFGL